MYKMLQLEHSGSLFQLEHTGDLRLYVRSRKRLLNLC